MKLAYFMNTYPLISTTFIRREIEAHERAGVPILRFAIRPWDSALVDPKDIAEAQKVTYLLRLGAVRLVAGALREAVLNPVRMARALAATLHLIRKARTERWKNFAYLLEAVALKQRTVAAGVTHLHTHFSSNSAAVAMLCRMLGGPPYSVTVHGPDELYVMEENAVALKLRHAAFFAVITEYCRGVVDGHTGGAFADKLKVLRCGLDLRDFETVTAVPDTKHLVCVGRLCAAKAQTALVEALAQVVEAHPGVKLLLIGDGDTRPDIEALIARHGLEAHVTLAGWKSGAEVQEAIRQARALVLPSLAEGLPIVLMEAFALGRPVLSTTITGIPELVDDSCGWLAAPGDAQALVAPLEDLLTRSPEALTQMAGIGRARVEQLHDQDRNAALLRDLFRDSTPPR